MIPEVDAALRSMVQGVGGTRDVEVVFDAPTKEWASRRSAPTVDVYLYDIREDLRRRERGLINEYDDGRVTARHLPPRHFKLSYLITAWTQRPEDEHRLLSGLLQLFLLSDAIPAEHLTGSLAALGLPVPVTIALPPPEDRSFADVWSSLGGELKPSLDLVVSAPIDTGRRYQAGPPVAEPLRPTLSGADGSPITQQRADGSRLLARVAAGEGEPATPSPTSAAPGSPPTAPATKAVGSGTNPRAPRARARRRPTS